MSDPMAQLQPILAAIMEAGGQPLIVGGAVRDYLMGHQPKDIDVEVYGLDVEQLTRVLARFGRINAVGRSFGILKLRTPDGYEFDVSLPRRENKAGAGHRGFIAEPDPSMTPREAAARRDFTFNALAMTPDGELLDFFGGQADLAAGIIRHTTAAFAEDPLRVLRAMQFAARFDMRMAPETVELCRSLLHEAHTLSSERIWGEWYKWALKGRKPSAGLQVLRESGWIELYPELAALIDCPQNPEWHPEGTVYQHTLFVCDAAAQVAERDALEDHERVVLLFAALSHDLGKPATTALVDGRIRSPGHAEAGLVPARLLLRRLGSPENVLAPVLPLVREHLVHIGLNPTERAVRRLALRLEPATIEQWGRLVEADHSGRPPLPPGAPGAEIVAMAQRLGTATGSPAPILMGRHLLDVGWQRGPELGEVLRRAYQAQIDGAFTTVEEGLIWVARNIRET